MSHDDVTPREILRLAVPALGALLAQPLFVVADAAIIGHLGTPALAGLGVAGTILNTVVGVAIFLAFGTTAAVARHLGAGRQRDAISVGVDATWLALTIGLVAAALVAMAAPPLVRVLGLDTGDQSGVAALEYLRVGVAGLPAMLIVLAATGLVRGLQDTKLTLYVAVGGALLNIPLNFALVYGVAGLPGLGIAGSALGTVIAQWAMALTYLVVIVSAARRHRVTLRPRLGGVGRMGRDALPLFVRSVCLRAAIVLTTMTAARFGEVQLASFNVIIAVWMFFSNLLDALEVAGQALVGKHLGARRVGAVNSAMRTLKRWSVVYGSLLALAVCAFVVGFPGVFSPDPEVQQAVRYGALVIAVAQPMCGYVYALDGVLVGAGDNRYLGRAMALCLAGLLPLLGVVAWQHEAIVRASADGLPWGLLATLSAYSFGFMGIRALTQWWRVRGDVWMHLEPTP
ncbi:MATE family efflux transporter [Micrococcales bacterium 31B]|nr:MATE family efflux transporter [Micrococcales bacterium 31B]